MRLGFQLDGSDYSALRDVRHIKEKGMMVRYADSEQRCYLFVGILGWIMFLELLE